MILLILYANLEKENDPLDHWKIVGDILRVLGSDWWQRGLKRFTITNQIKLLKAKNKQTKQQQNTNKINKEIRYLRKIYQPESGKLNSSWIKTHDPPPNDGSEISVIVTFDLSPETRSLSKPSCTDTSPEKAQQATWKTQQ